MILIINGPLGIGKTTIAWYLLEKFRARVMLDGDYIAAFHPFDHYNPTHLDLCIQHVSCAHRASSRQRVPFPTLSSTGSLKTLDVSNESGKCWRTWSRRPSSIV